MGFFELFLTAVALSMDAMAVSISSGISSSRVRLWDAVKMALFFGAFQAFMPMIGYYIIPLLSAVFGSGVETFVNNFDHWIAFVLLAFIGGKMIIEAIKNEPEDEHTNPFALGTLIVMSIATSIDALATGIVFRGFNLDAGARTFVFLAIGITTFILSARCAAREKARQDHRRKVPALGCARRRNSARGARSKDTYRASDCVSLHIYFRGVSRPDFLFFHCFLGIMFIFAICLEFLSHNGE